MMCFPCGRAGEEFARGDVRAAEELHKQCTDPNCTCQHKTDRPYINEQAMRAAGLPIVGQAQKPQIAG